jgi:hypothetical protein
MSDDPSCPYCRFRSSKLLGTGGLLQEDFPPAKRQDIGSKDKIVWCNECAGIFGVSPAGAEYPLQEGRRSGNLITQHL